MKAATSWSSVFLLPVRVGDTLCARLATALAALSALLEARRGWQPGTVSSDRLDDHHLTVQLTTDVPSK